MSQEILTLPQSCPLTTHQSPALSNNLNFSFQDKTKVRFPHLLVPNDFSREILLTDPLAISEDVKKAPNSTFNAKNSSSKLMSSPKSKSSSLKPSKVIRPATEIMDRQDFPDYSIYYIKLSPSIPKISSTESSTFDITSDEFHEQESPFEYPHLNSLISSIHEPPFEAVKNPSIRNDLNSQVSIFLGRFQNYMEERLIRWGPSDSQFNNQATVDGHHPYQISNFQAGQEPEYSIFRSFKNWLASPDPQDTTQPLSHHLPPQTPAPLLSKILAKLDLKPNSSNSILPTFDVSRRHYEPERSLNYNKMDQRTGDYSRNQDNYAHSAPARFHDHIQLNYTPRAIPLSDFILTFEKPAQGHTVREHEILEGLDEDVQDLINGVDNFIMSFLCGAWDIMSSISCC